jgi:hypothetical protein
MTPSSLIKVYWSFGGTYWFCLHCGRLSPARKRQAGSCLHFAAYWAYSSTFKMEAVCAQELFLFRQHGVTSQKIMLFIVAALSSPNLTYSKQSCTFILRLTIFPWDKNGTLGWQQRDRGFIELTIILQWQNPYRNLGRCRGGLYFTRVIPWIFLWWSNLTQQISVFKHLIIKLLTLHDTILS